jgi:hypothetical protein
MVITKIKFCFDFTVKMNIANFLIEQSTFSFIVFLTNYACIIIERKKNDSIFICFIYIKNRYSIRKFYPLIKVKVIRENDKESIKTLKKTFNWL